MYDPDELEEIRESKAQWEEDDVQPTVDRFGERKETFTTDTGGNVVKRLYTPDDADVDYDEDVGFPGEKPYTRGVYPTMHRGRLWTMRQYAGLGTATETNERFHYLIDNGRPGCRWRSTCPRRWATTPTTRWPPARSAKPASPSTRSTTWRPCSTASRWSRCRRA